MAEQDIETLWRTIVADLLALSAQPSSQVPTLTPQERAYLQLVRPVMLVDGYAILSAPHAAAKTVVEQSLAPHITTLLASHLGKHCTLAVSIQAPEAPPAPTPPAAPVAPSPRPSTPPT